MQLDGDFARLLEHLIRYVGEVDGLAGELIAARAEVDLRVRENLEARRRFVLFIRERGELGRAKESRDIARCFGTRTHCDIGDVISPSAISRFSVLLSARESCSDSQPCVSSAEEANGSVNCAREFI